MGASAMTLLADSDLCPVGEEEAEDATFAAMPWTWVSDTWGAAREVLTDYQAAGVKTAFIVRTSTYSDLDAIEFLEFHRASDSLVTRAVHENGALEFWTVETERLSGKEDIRNMLLAEENGEYRTGGYLNRLEHPRDLRQLALDGLSARCGFRPRGFEVRPGLWMEDGAEVHRKARIVAPAFLGSGARVEEQCLITRGSNVERNSLIDYATVVENSSILANSYVGIGLDVIHSIVDGSLLCNLKRDVSLKIADRDLVRRLETRKPFLSAPILTLQSNDSSARRERRDFSGEVENTCSLPF
jgi:NDP-sugar pyrophosphorylase family protein